MSSDVDGEIVTVTRLGFWVVWGLLPCVHGNDCQIGHPLGLSFLTHRYLE